MSRDGSWMRWRPRAEGERGGDGEKRRAKRRGSHPIGELIHLTEERRQEAMCKVGKEEAV